MDIRDETITGSFAIGSDGRKEPIDWKQYSLKLEAYIEKLLHPKVALATLIALQEKKLDNVITKENVDLKGKQTYINIK